jgi:hypothetical protein
MGHIRDAIERNIAEKGGPMTLRRPPAPGRPMLTAPVQAFAVGYSPGEVEGEIQIGDRKVMVLASEVAAANIGTPAIGWQVIEDGTQERVLAAFPIKDAGETVAFRLWVRV